MAKREVDNLEGAQPDLFGNAPPARATKKSKRRTASGKPIPNEPAPKSPPVQATPSHPGLAGRLVVWAKPALTEGAHKFVVHSVQAILFAALAAISSVVIYLVDPWPKIARYLPLKEISERELISKGVPKAAPSQIETSTPQAKDPKPAPGAEEQAPMEPRTIQPWTTDVYPERD